MMPSPAIHDHGDTCHSCWLSVGRAQARISAPDLPTVALPILSRYAQITRSHRSIRPCLAESRSRQPLQSNLSKPEPATKSP